MPRPNLGKLKASVSSKSSSDSAKKQQNISRFFGSKSKSPVCSSSSSRTSGDGKADDAGGSSGSSGHVGREAEIEIIEDVPMKDKLASPAKSIQVKCAFRKRTASASPKGRSSSVDNKRVKLNKTKTDSKSLHLGASSKDDTSSSQSLLSRSTRNLLSTFQLSSTRTASPVIKSKQLDSKRKKASNISDSSTDCISTSQDSGFSGSQNGDKSSHIKPSRSSSKKVTSKDKAATKVTPAVIPGKSPCKDYTPLEQQYMEIKQQYPDALLFVECGYKYKFFGQDAEIAAKELNIFCHLDHNFMVASIPVHRLFVHARRLVAKGYKVGVVKQTETAALKAAGDNKNAPFKRQLSALYTKSTMIGEDVNPVSSVSDLDDNTEPAEFSSSSSSYLLCLSEFMKAGTKSDKPENMKYGVVAVQPATGDIIYDCFHDNKQLSELDSRLHHIQPVELLVPLNVSDRTEKLIKDFATSSLREDDRVRIERIDNDQFVHSVAFEEVSAFYKSQNEGKSSQAETDSSHKSVNNFQDILSLPAPVICCLAALLKYLKEFLLHRVLRESSNFVPFSAATNVMKLNACAVRNLELFKNQTNGGEKGSLFWVLNHTSTRFGSRMLRKWVSQPLMDASLISSRQHAIDDILNSDCQALSTVKDLLVRAPDLERGLCSIYHKKCSTAEFVTTVKYLHKISTSMDALNSLVESQLKSDLLRAVFIQVPVQLQGIESYLTAINEKAAKAKDKTNLFVDTTSFPAVRQCQEDIQGVLAELKDHRKEVRKVLKSPSIDYKTVSGAEFLIEVKNSRLKDIPSSWKKISSTKQVSRFHSPFIVKMYKKLSQLREQLKIECQIAWLQFLDLFGARYFAYRQAIQHLALLDCLFSLAKVAAQDGYTKPELSEEAVHVNIENGRHPIVSALLSGEGQYVPNNTHMQADGQRCMIITGPNMGGKSSYIKQVALLCIMAQIGSYVPAESAKIGILDAVYTRMGASDNIYQNRSTFMVELSEASEIICHATRRSLIILDELGRGTSTHDGVAIACATAKHFISEVQCMMLFVTHYPPLAELEKLYPDHVANYHMSFLLQDSDEDDIDVITFLYQLVEGMAGKSYGLNVAKLAEIPLPIIKVAAGKSQELETAVMATRDRKIAFRKLWKSAKEELASVVNEYMQTGASAR